MLLLDFVIALIFTVVLTAAFAAVAKRRASFHPGWAAVLLALLVAWFGGIWAVPAEPAVRGVYWLPFFFSGVLALLVVWSLSSSRKPAPESADRKTVAQPLKVSLGAVYWVLLTAVAVLIILRYLYPAGGGTPENPLRNSSISVGNASA